MVENVFSHEKKAPGHPYGRGWVNAKKEFAFQRISKNGSSTAVHSLKTRDTIELSSLEELGLSAYCALRDPVDRLVSSIPETLKRATPDRSKYYGSVEVSEEVFEQILALDSSSAVSLGLGFMEIVKQFGPFDSHHEAQYKFLFDSSGNRYTDSLLFPLENMNLALVTIARRHSGSIPRIRRRNVRNRKVARPVVGLKHVGYHHAHPITFLNGGQQRVEWNQLRNLLVSFYRELRSSPSVWESARAIAASSYSIDTSLVEALLTETSKRNPFVRLSEIQ